MGLRESEGLYTKVGDADIKIQVLFQNRLDVVRLDGVQFSINGTFTNNDHSFSVSKLPLRTNSITHFDFPTLCGFVEGRGSFGEEHGVGSSGNSGH